MICNFEKTCNKAKNNKCNKQCDEFCIKEFRLINLLKNSLLTEKQMIEPMLKLDDHNVIDEESYCKLKSYYDNINEFVKNGNNIYIYSTNTGNGKTSWALKLLIHYLSSIWHSSSSGCHGLFINVPRFLLSLKSYISDKSDTYIPTIQSNVLDADIIVWDDIATKSMTEYEIENLLSIINARMDAGKTNIFTSNINPDKLNEYVGDRLASRILLCEWIGFRSPDLRGINFDSINNN